MAKRMRGLYKRQDIWWCSYLAPSGKYVRESTRFKDYNLAVDFLMKRKVDIMAGIEPDVRKAVSYTFKDLAKEYVIWCERQRGFSRKKRFIKQLVDRFGDYPLKAFSTMECEKYQAERLAKGMRMSRVKVPGGFIEQFLPNKPATVNRMVAVLKHCFHKGLQWDMLDELTYKKVQQVKQLEVNNTRLRFLTKEECHLLLNACSPHLKPIVTMALNTGMRRGEILGLTWDDIDLTHGFIFLTLTKNGERREIPINNTLRMVLESLPRRLDNGPVFFDPLTGNPFQDVRSSFESALKKAGIRDFKFHDLRHTAASHLVMGGVDLTTVSRILGHKDLKMTLRYSHLSPLHLTSAINVLDNALSEKPVSNSVSQFYHNLVSEETVYVS